MEQKRPEWWYYVQFMQSILSTMMLKTPPKRLALSLPRAHMLLFLTVIFDCIRNTYILINHKATQEIYIILANTDVFWSWSLMHH